MDSSQSQREHRWNVCTSGGMTDSDQQGNGPRQKHGVPGIEAPRCRSAGSGSPPWGQQPERIPRHQLSAPSREPPSPFSPSEPASRRLWTAGRITALSRARSAPASPLRTSPGSRGSVLASLPTSPSHLRVRPHSPRIPSPNSRSERGHSCPHNP